MSEDPQWSHPATTCLFLSLRNVLFQFRFGAKLKIAGDGILIIYLI